MVIKKIVFWAMVAIFSASVTSIPCWAMTNEEFLSFCASTEPPDPDLEKGGPSISEVLKANPNLDVNFQNSDGMTPLMHVAANKALDLRHNDDRVRTGSLRALLAAGARINQQDKKNRATALMFAVSNEAHASTVHFLLENGADPALPDKHGQNALELAVEKHKNPAVSGLLLSADRVSKGRYKGPTQAESQHLLERAKKNPNPQVLALLKSWAGRPPPTELWQPLFTALPSDQALVEAIKTTALNIQARIQELPKEREQTATYDFLIWQTHLSEDLEALKLLGINEARAWRHAYTSYLRSIQSIQGDGLSRNASLPEPAKLLAQVNYGKSKFARYDWKPIFVQTENKILVAERTSGLVGYELATGNELWCNPFSGDQYTTIDNLIVSLNAVQDDALAQITVIDANNGRTLWQTYNPEYWLTDPQRQFLIIVGADLLASFDLTKYGQENWITVIPLDRNDKDAARQFFLKQGITLADYFEIVSQPSKSGAEGEYAPEPKLLKQGFVGFYTENPYLGSESLRLDLGKGRYLDSSKALVRDIYGFNQFSLWSDNDNRLVLFDRQSGRGYPLAPVQTRTLKTNDLKYIPNKENSASKPQILASFSPSGNLLGITDQDGNLHFFSTRDNGKWLGSSDGKTPVHTPKPSAIKDTTLVNLLDDGDLNNPLVLLSFPNQPDTLIVAQFDLSKGLVAVLPHPGAGETVPITAFALSAANQAAVGLENGRLWLLDMVNGQMRQTSLENDSACTALSYSSDGKFVALATQDGHVTVMDQAQKIVWQQASGLKHIACLAVDTAGQRVWALVSNMQNISSPRQLCLITAKSKPKITDLSYKGMGLDFELRYDQSEDKALLTAFARDDFEGNTVRQKNLPLAEIQAVLKIFSASHSLQTVDNESILSAFSCSDLLGLSNDGTKLILEGGYEYTQAFNPHYFFDLLLDSTSRLNNGSTFSSCVQSIGFSDDDRLVVLGERGSRIGSRFLLYNLQSGNLLSAMLDANKHPLGVKFISFLHNNPRKLLTIGGEGSMRLWDLADSEPINLLSWFFFKNGNQVVVAQDSRFDTPDLDQLQGVHWTLDKRPGRTVALASLMKAYFQPRLAEYVLNNKKLPPLPPIDQLNLAQHGVRLLRVEPEKDAPGKVAVTVEVYVRGQDPIHPAQELKLFRDGQLVGKYTGDNGGLFDLPEGKKQITFRNIALPQNKNQAMFKAWAFNNDGVRSKYFERPYDYKQSAKVAPKLHLVAVGVNNFDNPTWDLKLAANDARGYAEILPTKLPHVKSDVQLLASGAGLTKPTKDNLKAALQKLADGGSSPDDVVVMAISSHGLTDDKDNQFYIIPADIPGKEKRITPELLQHSISTDELGDWLAKVDAGEFIMILDTCQSGAALGGDSFKPGPMGDKGLGQLAYDKAMRVLTATNENNAAMEIGDLGHGLLSYALLVDGLERGHVGTSANTYTFSDWLAYGKARTAELYTKIAKGESLGATRGKAKVVKTADNANPPLGQEPYLFDFAKQSKESVRFQVK